MFDRLPFIQSAVAAFSLAAITFACFSFHAPLRVALCLYLALIVALSFLGNARVSIGASILAVGCLDYFFTAPLFTLNIADPDDALVLLLFIAVTLAITTMVARIRQHARQLREINAALEEHIAARKRTETMLQQAQEFARVNRVMLMGQMTASIAHEVNQPLTGIVSNAGTSLRYLTAATPDVEEARTYLELVVRDGRRAADIISRVRGLARRAPPAKSLVDVNDAITEVLALAQGQLNRRATQVALELADDLPRVPADRVQLQQVLLNLILNAVEAMSDIHDRERAVAVVSGPMDAERIFVEVRDSGTGLKPEDADRLFNPFYTTKSDGMGMGLSISRLIVEGHGGELVALANQPAGAVFRLTLPLKDTEV